MSNLFCILILLQVVARRLVSIIPAILRSSPNLLNSNKSPCARYSNLSPKVAARFRQYDPRISETFFFSFTIRFSDWCNHLKLSYIKIFICTILIAIIYDIFFTLSKSDFDICICYNLLAYLFQIFLLDRENLIRKLSQLNNILRKIARRSHWIRTFFTY